MRWSCLLYSVLIMMSSLLAGCGDGEEPRAMATPSAAQTAAPASTPGRPPEAETHALTPWSTPAETPVGDGGLSPEDRYAWVVSRTREACERAKGELPYQEDTFSIEGCTGGQMFVVEVKASSWEEYARIRREATFFRERGMDPCELSTCWLAPDDLMQIPMPTDLDLGCDEIQGGTPTPATGPSSTVPPTPVPSEEIYLSPQPEPGIVPTPIRYLPEGGVAPESIQALQEEMRAIERDCPIAQLLPYGGPFDNQPFFIDSPTRERVIWISIDEASDQEEAKKTALGWIQGQGYDPENLGCQMRFEVVAFPN